jgi:hypothetical protein
LILMLVKSKLLFRQLYSVDFNFLWELLLLGLRKLLARGNRNTERQYATRYRHMLRVRYW